MKKSICFLGISFCLCLSQINLIKAEETAFVVEEIQSDGTTTRIDEASSYTAAKASYDAHVATANNIQIRQGDEVWKLKYGVVLFATSETCDYNVTYLTDQGNGYTNGCYGIDAAYTGSSTPGYLDFYLSGVHGSTSSEDVTLQPIETAKNVSNYIVENGILYHQIKTDQDHDFFTSKIDLGKAPAYLEDKQAYYSYDGHYFYPIKEDHKGFHQMIDDLQANVHTHAINANEPFYQYYQFLSHRSTTNYSEEEIQAYFQDRLHIQGPLTTYRSMGTSYHATLTQSFLYNSAPAFLHYQNQFGTNAMMMLSLAMNESATGRSYLAYTRNNLFGHAAFDSAVEENASRYASIEASIYSHAKHYLQESYLDPDSFTWHGGYFGNKASGMNVSYASDPYWGEKAASYYTQIDRAMGEKDNDFYAIGIVTSKREVPVYQQPEESSTVLYTTKGLLDYAFLIRAQQDGWYQVQSDPAIEGKGDYDASTSVGYVKTSDIDDLSMTPNRTASPDIAITFDAQDGTFEGSQQKVTMRIKENQIPTILPPQKDGWIFVGWDTALTPATKEMTYTAQYEPIQVTRITTMPKQEYEIGEELDVSHGVLEITSSKGKKLEIPMNSAMVSGYDASLSGTQTITVTYQGASTTYDIQVKESNETTLAATLTNIQTLLEQTSINDDLTSEQTQSILAIKKAMDQDGIPELSYEGYRLLDTMIQMAYGNALSIQVSDDDMGISVSGLSIATQLDTPSFFPQTIHFDVEHAVDEETETILTQVAEGNGYQISSCFTMDAEAGNSDIALQDDVLVAMAKPQENQLNTYYVILHYEDGEVIQLPVSQSDALISFATDALGEFALAYRQSDQIYAGNDIIENNSTSTNRTSILQYLLWGSLLTGCILLVIITILVRKKRKPPLSKHKKQTKRHKSTKPEASASPTSFLSSHQIYADEPDQEE